MRIGNHQLDKNTSFYNSSRRILAAIACILFAGQIGFVNAQGGIKSADTGFKPGNSYSISDIETISVYGGNLMLKVPLGSLAP